MILRSVRALCLPLRKYKIFYNDGSTVEGGSDDDELVPVYFPRKWLEAPSDGVSHINIAHSKSGRATLKQQEYYFIFPEGGHGDGYVGGSMKIGAFLRQTGLVKFGGWTHENNYSKIALQANQDEYIERQKARLPENDEDQAD